MKTLKFKCTLESDIILNQKAATEGPNETLDYIPGSNFLGVAAGVLYPKDTEKNSADYAQRMAQALEIFHGRGVRFGDAHPASGNHRSLRVPASMYYPKLQKPEDGCYIMDMTDTDNPDIRKMQLKQCRSGFYDFMQSPALEVKTERNFAIKSAHDRDSRKSADSRMYGYQSLEKGLVLFFDVEVDREELADCISGALTGHRHIGRSRSAQFGLVHIELMESDPYMEYGESFEPGDKIYVYAASRLMFLDKDTMMPTFQPSAEDLGIEGGTVCWAESQIRTFQYAPWNFKRQCFDTDRCGIEKGSVIVVKGGKLVGKTYVGNYNNEGLGRVLYNPAFLQVQPGEGKEKGLAVCLLKAEKKGKPTFIPVSGDGLIEFLNQRKKNEDSEQQIYELVNAFVRDHASVFYKDSFSSQWGKIRSLTLQIGNVAELKKELFEKTVKKRVKDKDKEFPAAYLTHGVAAAKWSKRGRLELLKHFIEDVEAKKLDVRKALINLASQMAKHKEEEE